MPAVPRVLLQRGVIVSRHRRIGILTGGGDVPGLNSVIKSVVYRATELGYEVLGIRRGWEGLTHQRRGDELDPDYVRILDRINTRTIDRTGGTMLHTSRTNPRRWPKRRCPRPRPPAGRCRPIATASYDLTDHVLDNLEHLGLSHLVTIGGDDTLSFCAVLAGHGVPLVAIPKTMDNDVNGTEYCIGFSSAITRAQGADQPPAHDARQPRADRRVPDLRARRRVHRAVHGVRHARRCVIPEFPYDLDALAELLKEDHRNNPSRYAMVITAEGAIWQGAAIAGRGRRRRLRPPPQDERRRGARGRAQGPDRDRGRRLRADLRPAVGRARHARLDGRDDVRERRDGPASATGSAAAWSPIRDGKYDHVSLAETGSRRGASSSTPYTRTASGPKYADRLGDPLLLTPSLGPAPASAEAAVGSSRPARDSGADRAREVRHVLVAVAPRDEPGLELRAPARRPAASRPASRRHLERDAPGP